MEQIKEATYLFNFSVRRKNILSEKVKINAPQRHKLVDVCRTEWLVSLKNYKFIKLSVKWEKINVSQVLTARTRPNQTHCSSLLLTLVLFPH